jgi:hypothetical protein
MTRMYCLCLMLLLVGAVACGKIPDEASDGGGIDGGGDDDDDAPDGSLPDRCKANDLDFDEFLDCFVPLECGLFVDCLHIVPTLEDCRTQLIEAGEFGVNIQRIKDSIAAGYMSFDPVAGQACIGGLAERLAAGVCDLDLVECNAMFVGTVASGGACNQAEECAALGSRCDQPSSSGCQLQCCVGSCIDPIPVNGDCTGTSNCVPGAHCASVAGQQVCVTGDVNTACTGNSGCDNDLYCADMKCVARVAEGKACQSDSVCAAGLVCVGDSIGIMGTGSCEKANKKGDACDGRCGDSLLFCNQPQAGMLGSCTEIPSTAGADCTLADNCAPPLSCRENVCEAPLAENATCTSYRCATGLFCTTELDGAATGTCKKPLPTGSTCNSTGQCQTHICASSTAGTPTETCQAYDACELP